MTGQPGTYTPANFAGLQAWVDWTNAHGGIGGHKLQLFTADDHNDPGKALIAMQGLVQNDHVQAIVGSFASGAETGFANYVNKQHIPVIGGNAYTPVWISNPMFFDVQTYFNASVWSQPYDVKQAGAVKTAVSVGESAASIASAQPVVGFAKELGVQVVYTATVSSTQPNYTAVCLAAKNAGATAWIFAGGGQPNRIASDCAQQGYNPVYVNAGASLTPTLAASAQLANEWTPEYSFPYFSNSPALADYKAAMNTYYPQTVGGFRGAQADQKLSFATSAAWAAGITFAQAVRNAKIPADQPVTSQDIVNGLLKIHNFTAGGLVPSLNFTANPAGREVKCFYNVKLNNHQFVSTSPDLVCLR